MYGIVFSTLLISSVIIVTLPQTDLTLYLKNPVWTEQEAD